MTITTKALKLVDGWTKLTQAEQVVKDELARTSQRTNPALISSTDFADAAVAGADFPENPHQYNEGILHLRKCDAVRTEMLKTSLKTLQGRRQTLLAEGADAALAYLSTELDALMGEVRDACKVLVNITTPEQVLNADNPAITSAWKNRQELIARYTEIREAHSTLTKPGMVRGEEFKIAAVGHIRNSLEQSSYWLTRRADSVSSRSANDTLAGVRNFDTWLGNGGTAPFKHSTSAIPSTDSNGNPVGPWEYLVWLATKAEPWVPSASQMNEAFNAAQRAVATTGYAKYRAQEAARDDYFGVIDRNPLVPYTQAPSSEKPEKRRYPKKTTWGDAYAGLIV